MASSHRMKKVKQLKNPAERENRHNKSENG